MKRAFGPFRRLRRRPCGAPFFPGPYSFRSRGLALLFGRRRCSCRRRQRVSLPFHAMPLSLLKRKITRYFGGPGTDSLSTICGMKYCDAEVRAPQIPGNFIDHTFSDDPAIRRNHQKEIPVFFLNSLQKERGHLFPGIYFFASRQPCRFLIKRAVILSVVRFRVFLLRRSYHQSVLFPCKAVIQFCHLCECPFSLYFVRLFFARALCRCLSAWQQPYRRQFAAPPVPLCVRTAAPSRPAGPARLFLSVRFHFIRAVFSF